MIFLIVVSFCCRFCGGNEGLDPTF